VTRNLAIAALGLAALILAYLGFLAFRAQGQVSLAGLHGTPVTPDRAFGPATLVAQNGQAVRLPLQGATYTLVFFGYTHCPDVCPVGLATMARAARKLGDPPQLGLAFVTVDPARDTPPVLAAYTKIFDPKIVGLTGTPAQLTALWNAFGVAVQPVSKEVVHGETIFLVDASGKLLLEYPPDGSAGDIASDARALLRM
jgi:protein SCO1/2